MGIDNIQYNYKTRIKLDDLINNELASILSGKLKKEKLERIKENIDLIKEITGENEIKISDLEDLCGLKRKNLEKIKKNINLIYEITGENKIEISDLVKLSELKIIKLERIRENMDLIYEITGENKIEIINLDSLSELKRKDLERIREYLDLIHEITGESKIEISDLESLSKISRKDLERIRENLVLINEITENDKIEISDLESLSKISREDLEKIRENSVLINEITENNKIRIRDLKTLNEMTKKELEEIKENEELILEITGEDNIYTSEFKYLKGLTREDLERIKENMDLILEIKGEDEINITELKYLKGLKKEDLEKIKENIDLIFEITGKKQIRPRELGEFTKLTKEELKQIKENKNLILTITGESNIYFRYLKEFSKLTREDLEKILKIIQYTGKNINTNSDYDEDGIFDGKPKKRKGYLNDLLEINERTLNYCKNKNIKELWMIVMIEKFINKTDKIRDYIKRKEEYLKNNRLIDDDEFKRLFGGGKYGKGEINQKGLGYCYLYTAIEIFKKMNYFEVLIKTSLRISENGDGWYVKLPMGQSNGNWLFVSKDDIDKKFDIPRKGGISKGVSINTDSPLGLRIIEIAYIKKALIDSNNDNNKEFLNTGNIRLTGDKLHYLEGSNTIFALSTLIGDDNIINGNARIIEEDNYIDIVFDNFKKGLNVDLAVKDKWDNDKEVKINMNGEIESQVIEKDIKIISKDESIQNLKSAFIKNDDNVYELKKNENNNEEMLNDIIEINNEKFAIFYREHAYSIERCYIDKKTGEKRVWIVNPRHTGIKFDISLENAKKIFDWEVSYINIDKLFR